jgi:hypothetical protein
MLAPFAYCEAFSFENIRIANALGHRQTVQPIYPFHRLTAEPSLARFARAV